MANYLLEIKIGVSQNFLKRHSALFVLLQSDGGFALPKGAILQGVYQAKNPHQVKISCAGKQALLFESNSDRTALSQFISTVNISRSADFHVTLEIIEEMLFAKVLSKDSKSDEALKKLLESAIILKDIT